MKKYIPSIKNNNAVKEELIKELRTVLFKIEKGKYSKALDSDAVKEIYENLKNSYETLESVLFTGSENINSIKDKVINGIDNVKKMLEQDYANRLSEAADELLYYVDGLSAISYGEIDELEEQNETARKVSWARKRLDKRLAELKEIKDTFTAQEKRLEKEIETYEKDVAELDTRMLNEENERVINELYRKITTAKSKLDMLNVRRSNYSACFGILDIIYANAAEILTASTFSMEELGKAKALLNIGRLKNVINEPDKAIAILKVMEKDIQTMSDKVKNIDERVYGLNTEQTSVTDSALAYKESLMRRKREKESQADDLGRLKAGIAEPKQDKLKNEEDE